MTRKTPYTYGTRLWPTLLGSFVGAGTSTLWVLPTLAAQDPGFLWGAPLTFAAGTISGYLYQRRLRQVDLVGLKQMRKVDAALQSIRKLRSNPAIVENDLIERAYQEALKEREEFLTKVVELRDLRQSGVFSHEDLTQREEEAQEVAKNIFIIAESLHAHLRETEKFRRSVTLSAFDSLLRDAEVAPQQERDKE